MYKVKVMLIKIIRQYNVCGVPDCALAQCYIVHVLEDTAERGFTNLHKFMGGGLYIFSSFL